ncbi:MAG: hypothetical protein FWD47_09630 [Treponema sp.]|nr:hypothetical protein [Treponema sp.]
MLILGIKSKKERKGLLLMFSIIALIFSIVFFVLGTICSFWNYGFTFLYYVFIAIATAIFAAWLIEIIIGGTEIRIELPYSQQQIINKRWIPMYKEAINKIYILGIDLQRTTDNLINELEQLKDKTNYLKIRIILSDSNNASKSKEKLESFFYKMEQIDFKIKRIKISKIKYQIGIIDNALMIIPYKQFKNVPENKRPILINANKYNFNKHDFTLEDFEENDFYDKYLKEFEKLWKKAREWM